MKEDDFEMEMEGCSEDHEYAMDLIRNLVKVSKEELNSRILFEVMMVYSLGWNMAHGDHDLMTKLLPNVLDSINDGSYTDVAEIMEEERICH